MNYQDVNLYFCLCVFSASLICDGSAVMSSGHGSSPLPHSSGGGGTSDGFFRKPRDPSAASRHYRTPRSLPDVCPKEPTGEYIFLRSLMNYIGGQGGML